jgi:hypothetical protein
MPLDEDRLHLLATLDRHGVQHVVVSDLTTELSVVIAPYARNVERAIDALSELHATVRVPGTAQTFPLPVDALRARKAHGWALTTARGDLYMATATADGIRYGELLLDSVPRELRPGLTVELAAMAQPVA